MTDSYLFSILDTIDSTNNYAMARIRDCSAAHGMAWFANMQTGGKGQRGNSWIGNYGENIALSIAVKPVVEFAATPFLLNAIVANACQRYFSELILPEKFCIKWPNDIYLGDRKAGGILIENQFVNNRLAWSVIGIGFNINQTSFPENILGNNPISVFDITNNKREPVELAKELHKILLQDLNNFSESGDVGAMKYYNDNLYKKNEWVRLKSENRIFKTQIISVTKYGELITNDVMERHFRFGEVSWLFS